VQGHVFRGDGVLGYVVGVVVAANMLLGMVVGRDMF
jgi:hypothetical protein